MVLLHENDCVRLGVDEGDRIRLSGRSCMTVIVSMSDTLLDAGTVLIPQDILDSIGSVDGDEIEVTIDSMPASVKAIHKKIDGGKLDPDEINAIVEDVMCSRLSHIEIAAWLTALHINCMDVDEIAAYTVAISRSGGRLDFDDRFVLDFHSFGGIPGNKITPIVVSIVAAAGLTIPKLSSRAISSACGTADFVETFCDIELDDDDIRRISEECGGTFSWTGSTDLGPAGDVFIRTQRPLGIDPRPQMLASIMGKKVAAGAKAILMDIPTGPETKVRTLDDARAYTRDLMDLGERLGIRVECAITPAEQPLGKAIGPILEARECMQVLERIPGHEDVADKAILCAGILLQLGGDPNGERTARALYDSGRAHEKFLQIVAAQGGDPSIRSSDMVPGEFVSEVRSPRSGTVTGISNKSMVAIAKAAGAPNDKGAGILFLRKCGDSVEEGEILFTIHADNIDKLEDAIEVAQERAPYSISL